MVGVGVPAGKDRAPSLTDEIFREGARQMTRHQAYQARLAGHTIAGTFTRAAAFLKLAAADVPALTDTSTHAMRSSTSPLQAAAPCRKGGHAGRS